MERLMDWLNSLTKPKCQHIWEARFRWEGEWADYYEKCVLCEEERI